MQSSVDKRWGFVKYFIISDGKTGSITLHCSFRSSFHAHYTSYMHSKCPELQKDNITLRMLQDFSRQNHGKKPWVILSVREPIGRTISAFFENLHTFVSQELQNDKEVVLEALNKNFIATENYHVFDDEYLEDHLDGLNLYDQPFDVEKGYAIYETERLRILVLKFEHIHQWETLIPTILPEEERIDFHYRPAHLSKNKPNYPLQQETIRLFKPTREMIKAKFDIHRKCLDHFYSPEQVETIERKWLKDKSPV